MNAPAPLVSHLKNGIKVPGFHDSNDTVEVSTGMVSEALGHPEYSLFPKREEALLTGLLKAVRPEGEGSSQQGVNLGIKAHPFDMLKVVLLDKYNEYHSTCLSAKTNAMTGLGWRLSPEEELAYYERVQQAKDVGAPAPPLPQSKVDRILNPLCDSTWRETLLSVGRDIASTHNGYLEIVRRAGGVDGLGPITGLHYLPASCAFVFIENLLYEKHYITRNTEGVGMDRVFADFGDLAAFKERIRNGGQTNVGGMSISTTLSQAAKTSGSGFVSELIHFKVPSNHSRYYGVPDWLSAVSAIDVSVLERQYIADFYNNRGVPEFMLFLIGKRIEKKVWDTIVASLKANIGSGNSRKSLAVNIDDPEIEIKLEKLAESGGGNDNKATDSRYEQLGKTIATAHGVPPVLAGILVSGKLGATNEFVNSLESFQLLRMRPFQEIIEQRLGCTLGNPTLNGGLDLTADDFHLTTITDVIDLDRAETVGRMRESAIEASRGGRDLSEGLED